MSRWRSTSPPTLLRHYEKNRALPLSRLHTLTLLCGETQTYNFYKEHRPEYGNRRARELFGDQLTVEFKFEENKRYIRKVLDQQIDLRQWSGQWLPKQEQCGW